MSTKLDEKAILPDDIQPYPGTVDLSAKPKTIFLTGATGFVAAYILSELLKQTDAKIYSLVRAKDEQQGMDRIRKNMEHYWLWEDQWADRIVPVPGDLKYKKLGLSDELFDQIAREADVVYMVGSKLSYIAPYEYLSDANVGGTIETLRLATMHKAKPYHFVSSLGILLNYDVPEGGEENAPLDEKKCPDVGYFQTKYVAERVVRMAGDRGVPVTVHRIGLIVGDSINGRSNEDDFVARIMIGAIHVGYGLDIRHAMDMTPVDYVSKAIVYLCQQNESVGKVFHLLNPKPISWGGIMDTVQEAGYPMVNVPFKEWLEKLEAHADPETNPAYPLMPFFQIEFAARMLGVSDNAYAALGTKATTDALEGSGITCPPVDTDLVRVYLQRFAEAGRIPEPKQA